MGRGPWWLAPFSFNGPSWGCLWPFWGKNHSILPLKCYLVLILKDFSQNIWSVSVAVILLQRFCGSQYVKLRERFF